MPTARILVVDDDQLIRQMVRDFLEVADFAVAEAVDGADGLAQAAALQPDLILLDLMMPEVDGYEVCRRLQADPATQAIPMIFLTASSNLDLNRKAYALGAVACLTKPFRREALLTVVQTTLHGATGRGKGRAGAGGTGASTSTDTSTPLWPGSSFARTAASRSRSRAETQRPARRDLLPQLRRGRAVEAAGRCPAHHGPLDRRRPPRPRRVRAPAGATGPPGPHRYRWGGGAGRRHLAGAHGADTGGGRSPSTRAGPCTPYPQTSVCRPAGRATTSRSSVGVRRRASCRFAPLTSIDSGIPCASTRRLRFVPLFPPVRRVGADGLVGQGAFPSAVSTLCHAQAMPSRSSYSARPCRQSRTKTPACFQARKYLWMALALPNCTLGNSFHWQPVRKAHTVPSKMRRGSKGFRPPPGFRRYWWPFGRFRGGINGATLAHNSSDTVQIRCALMQAHYHGRKNGTISIYG